MKTSLFLFLWYLAAGNSAINNYASHRHLENGARFRYWDGIGPVDIFMSTVPSSIE